VGGILSGGIMAGVGSALLGAGVPLLVVGRSEERAAKRGIIIDALGPRAMPGGGGFGISGRF
jgi:hypothetical protein